MNQARFHAPRVLLPSLLFATSLFSAQTTHASPCDVTRPAQAQAYPCGVLATGNTPQALAVIGKSKGASVKHEYQRLGVVALSVPNAKVFDNLRYSSLRLYPDLPVKMHAGKGGNNGGSTSGEVMPEGVKRLGGPGTAADVGVAILDTGIDLANSDLKVGTQTYDAFGGSGADFNGHGTHVAGIVAAKQSNGVGVVGVVPDATVYAVRVLDASGSGSDSDIIGGLDWVLANQRLVTPGIEVVNMSLGRLAVASDADPQSPMRAAIKSLTDANIAVVVSAGNDQTREISQMVPSGFAEVLAIASTTAETGTTQCTRFKTPIPADTASYFTTDGAGIAASAPGAASENVSRGCMVASVGILSLKAGGGTTRMSGTSMAAPHVAGVVAALKQKNPGMSPATVRGCLTDYAQYAGTAPKNSPVSSYSFDGIREGVAYLPAVLEGCQ